MSWFEHESLDRELLQRRVVMATVVFWMYGSFGATDMGPTKFLLILGALVAASLALLPSARWAKIRVPLPILAFVLWWIASYVWSSQVGQWMLTAKGQFIPLVLILVLALAVPVDDVLDGFLAGFLILLAWTVVVVITQPATRAGAIGPFGEVVPGLRGPFSHKNQLAPFLLVGYYTFGLFGSRRIAIAILPVVGVLFALSRSTTGILLLAVLIAVHLWLLQWRRQDPRSRRGYVLVSGVLAGFAVFAWRAVEPLLLKAAGKDASLTGRTEIWAVARRLISQRPIVGWSPGTLWVDQSTEPTRTISQTIGFFVFHAHNGYLEILLELGAVGLALYALVSLGVLTQAGRRLRSDFKLAQWAIGIVMMLLVYSMSEIGTAGQWLSMTMLAYIFLIRSDEFSRPAWMLGEQPLGERGENGYLEPSRARGGPNALERGRAVYPRLRRSVD